MWPAARQPSATAPVGQGQRHSVLPTAPASYLGLYAAGVPGSYAGVTAFTAATGVKPRLVPYYSGWFEPFQARWNACHAYAGREVVLLEQGVEITRGVAAGVDESGQLLLDTASGREAIATGDVSLRLADGTA